MASRRPSKRSSAASGSSPKTSSATSARSPSSSHAGAAAPVKLASAIVPIPERRHSAAPRRAIATASPSSSRAFRWMWSAIQGANESVSPKPA